MPTNVEHDALISSYEHLPSMPRAADALHTIRKIASLVKPIMRKRNWRVRILTEFYPDQQNLLGLNVNMGYKICLRLRYPSDKSLFLPVEQVIDTMLHELSHNVFGPHDEKFHNLWEELRDEYTRLTLQGYTGEGFLGSGRRLGGSQFVPIQEMRRQARAAAEQRKRFRSGASTGHKLGGALIPFDMDIRQIIADAAQSRMAITRGCASEREDAGRIAEEASSNGFRTKAEEDDANESAIAQALWELVQEQEARRAGVVDWRGMGVVWNPGEGMQRFDPGDVEGDEDLKKGKSKSVAGSEKDAPPVPTWSKPKSKSEDSPQKPTTRSFLSRASPLRKKPKIADSKSTFTPTKTEPNTQLPPPQPLPPQTAAPAAPTPPQTWSCPICTLVNKSTSPACDACENPRPASITSLLAPTQQSNPSSHPSSRSNLKPNPPTQPRHPPPSTTSKIKPASSSSSARLLSITTTRRPSPLISAEEAAARAVLQPKMGWTCSRCGGWNESVFWSCGGCGNIKERS